MSSTVLSRRAALALSRGLPSGSTSTSTKKVASWGFCTSSIAKGKGKARSASSKDSSLSSLISLYHSTRTAPAVNDTQALNHYIDQKLLSKTPVRPEDMHTLIAKGSQQGKSRANQGALLYSPTTERGSSDDAYAYMEEEIVLDGAPAGPAGEADSAASALDRSLFNADSRAGEVWKPLRNKSNQRNEQRGRQVLDALAGTIDGQYAGPEMIREAERAFKRS